MCVRRVIPDGEQVLRLEHRFSSPRLEEHIDPDIWVYLPAVNRVAVALVGDRWPGIPWDRGRATYPEQIIPAIANRHRCGYFDARDRLCLSGELSRRDAKRMAAEIQPIANRFVDDFRSPETVLAQFDSPTSNIRRYPEVHLVALACRLVLGKFDDAHKQCLSRTFRDKRYENVPANTVAYIQAHTA